MSVINMQSTVRHVNHGVLSLRQMKFLLDFNGHVSCSSLAWAIVSLFFVFSFCFLFYFVYLLCLVFYWRAAFVLLVLLARLWYRYFALSAVCGCALVSCSVCEKLCFYFCFLFLFFIFYFVFFYLRAAFDFARTTRALVLVLQVFCALVSAVCGCVSVSYSVREKLCFYFVFLFFVFYFYFYFLFCLLFY